MGTPQAAWLEHRAYVILKGRVAFTRNPASPLPKLALDTAQNTAATLGKVVFPHLRTCRPQDIHLLDAPPGPLRHTAPAAETVSFPSPAAGFWTQWSRCSSGGLHERTSMADGSRAPQRVAEGAPLQPRVHGFGCRTCDYYFPSFWTLAPWWVAKYMPLQLKSCCFSNRLWDSRIPSYWILDRLAIIRVKSPWQDSCCLIHRLQGTYVPLSWTPGPSQWFTQRCYPSKSHTTLARVTLLQPQALRLLTPRLWTLRSHTAIPQSTLSTKAKTTSASTTACTRLGVNHIVRRLVTRHHSQMRN